MSYQLDLRYVGQEHTLAVTVEGGFSDAAKEKVAAAFDEQHLRVYGHNAPEEAKEIVSLKVIGLGNVTKPKLERIGASNESPPDAARLGTRDVYVGNGRYRPFAIYRRDALLAGNVIPGPAVIEEVTATAVVEPEQTCTVDPYGNLIISLNEEGK